MNSQTDKSLDDFDQTLDHRKQPFDTHNKVRQQISGTGNIISATGDVNVNQYNQHVTPLFRKKTKDYNDLIKDSQIPYFLLLFLFSVRIFLFFQGKNQEILSESVKEIVLISVTFILGSLWLISSDQELTILECHLGESLPRWEFYPRIISYSIPIFIMILSSTANYIHIYAFVYWIYIIVDIFKRKTATNFVRTAINKTRTDYGGTNEAIDKIYSYYIMNPFGLRGYITGFIFFMVSIVGLWTENLTDKMIYKIVIINILYAIAIGSIVLSEIVIWFWRIKFYIFISKYDDNERRKSIIDNK